MSIFREYDFGYNHPTKRDDEMLELRRRASQNLKAIREGKYRREAMQKQRDKRSELEKATAEEIEMGNMILEMRELRKIENRYARRKNLSDEDRAHWEEIDARLDTLRDEIGDMGIDEQRRCVRLWNKSRKVRYRLTEGNNGEGH